MIVAATPWHTAAGVEHTGVAGTELITIFDPLSLLLTVDGVLLTTLTLYPVPATVAEGIVADKGDDDPVVVSDVGLLKLPEAFESCTVYAPVKVPVLVKGTLITLLPLLQKGPKDVAVVVMLLEATADTDPFKTTLEVLVRYHVPVVEPVGAILILMVVPAATFCRAGIPLRVTEPDVPVVPLVELVVHVPAVV